MASRPHMTRENRAKQFMPFAALKGYEEALFEKEKIIVEKKELTDESREELDCKLKMIKKNDMISVVYYNKEEYIRISGRVSRLDKDSGILKIVNTSIPLEDIYEIDLGNTTTAFQDTLRLP